MLKKRLYLGIEDMILSRFFNIFRLKHLPYLLIKNNTYSYIITFYIHTSLVTFKSKTPFVYTSFSYKPILKPLKIYRKGKSNLFSQKSVI